MNHIKPFKIDHRVSLARAQSEALIRRAGLSATPPEESRPSSDDMRAIDAYLLDLAPLPDHISLTARPSEIGFSASIELTANISGCITRFEWNPPCLYPTPEHLASIKAHIQHGTPLPDGLSAHIIHGLDIVHISDAIGRAMIVAKIGHPGTFCDLPRHAEIY